MTESILSACPACADPLPPGLTAGHCPRCLLLMTVEEEVDDMAIVEETPWTTLGDCELHEEIGRGGMGVVYRARQRDLNRVVAVKALLDAGFASTRQRERFRREAEAVARLRHPGIVALHEFGESDGVPWFSMDYIEGQSLEETVRDHPLPDREAARCLREIALAVAHAHERGVLHRDLKPSNILLDTVGRPHVTDFGISLRLDGDAESAAALTRTGQSLGSPGYAAPELVLGHPADERTDVYGLGTILYHILTGRPPFLGATLESVLRQVRENDPVAPSHLNPAVTRDLETICLKCLRKGAGERYPSAKALTEDLDRYLRGEPILARPAGPLEIAWRWCRRRPAIASLIASVGALLVLLVAGSLSFAHRQQELEHRAALLVEVAGIRGAATSWGRDRALAALSKAWRIRPSSAILTEAIGVVSVPEMRPSPPEPIETSTVPPAQPASSGDNRFTATSEGGDAVVRRLDDRRVVARVPGFPEGSILLLDGTGRRLAAVAPGGSEVNVFSLPGGSLLHRCPHPDTVVSADWSAPFLATGCANHFLYLWRQDGSLHHRLIGHEAPPIVRFRPGGIELASVAEDKIVRLWDAVRGEELLSDRTMKNNAGPVRWEGDGTAFVFSSNRGRSTVRIDMLWPGSVRLLAPPLDIPGPENLRTMDLSPDGELVSTSDDGVCRVRSVATGRILASFPKGPKEWVVTRFSPDGKTLWLSGWDRGCIPVPVERRPGGAWDFGPPGEPLFGPGNLLLDLSRDGRFAVFGNNSEGCFVVGEIATGAVTRLPHPSVLAAAISPDGSRVATSSYASPSIRLWALPGGTMIGEIAPPSLAIDLHFSSESLTARTGVGTIRYRIDPLGPDPDPLPTERLEGGVWSPDGTLVACHEGPKIRLLRDHDLSEVVALPVPEAAGWTGNAQIAISSAKSILSVRTASGAIVVYDLPSLRKELAEWGMTWPDP